MNTVESMEYDLMVCAEKINRNKLQCTGSARYRVFVGTNHRPVY